MLDWVWQMMIGVLAAAGGGVGITIALFKKTADVMAERLSKKYELKINKELERFNAYFSILRDISREMLTAFDRLIDISPSSSCTFTAIDNTSASIGIVRKQVQTARGKVYEITTIEECHSIATIAIDYLGRIEDQLHNIEATNSTLIQSCEAVLNMKNDFIAQYSECEYSIIN